MKCPKCGTDLEYPTGYEHQDDEVFYPVSCPSCGFEGKEWYSLQFTTFTDSDGNDIPGKPEKENNEIH